MTAGKKYSEAFAELEALVKKIESPEADLSAVGDDVKRAMELIKWCRDYIRGNKERLDEILEDDIR